MTEHQLMFQRQAGHFATKREDVEALAATIRRRDLPVVVDILRQGFPNAAYEFLLTSFGEQVRVLSIRGAP